MPIVTDQYKSSTYDLELTPEQLKIVHQALGSLMDATAGTDTDTTELEELYWTTADMLEQYYVDRGVKE